MCPLSGVKRETGANPVQTRYCNWGADVHGESRPLADRPGRGPSASIHQPGNLHGLRMNPQSCGDRACDGL